ncbi:MAG: hypothetical protein B6I36_05300 [Desulfobacteraceae bacterium 4572_35.1]|nr:MAG: hypothetical protein B6I36_05300 [Desulfobacteraceae bacterium 4572_35.1]
MSCVFPELPPSFFASKRFYVSVAVVGSASLNFIIFMLLPYLVQSPPVLKSRYESTPVNVVRVVPPHLPQRQHAQKKPPKQVVQRQRIAQAVPKMATTPLHLKLKLRPEIPNTGGDIALPPVQLAQLKPLPAVFDSAALDQPLTPLAQSPFIYPLRAKRLGIEGWVKIKLLVSKQGSVEQVHIVAAQPDNVFEQTVKRGVRSWRFTPGTVDGQPVRSWVVTTVRFELE